MRTKLAGMQYWHLLSGFPAWGKSSGRYKHVLRIIAKKDVAYRNYFFNLILTNWAYSEFGRPARKDTIAKQNDIVPKYELRGEMAIGFFSFYG